MEQNAATAPAPGTAVAEPGATEMPSVVKRAILAAAIGNFVEWFDYGIYGFLAATIAVEFFPPTNLPAQVLSTIAVFAIGFIIRPIGGIIFGSRADKIGRRPVLIITVLLMSGATFLVGVLPPFSTIGFFAPLLLLILRLVQGLGAGGEIGSAMVIVAEYAPVRRRAFAGSMIHVASFTATVVGSLLVLLLNTTLSADALVSWGWRIPFLLALPLGLFGLYLRLRIEETPEFRELEKLDRVAPAPNREVLRTAPAAMFVVAGITATTAVGLWMLVTYMASYLSGTLGFTGANAILSVAAGAVAALVATPIGGLLSDRFGRRRLLMITTALLAIAAYPCFLLFAVGPLGFAILGLVIFGFIVGLFDGGFTASMSELFPTRFRTAGISLPYNIGAAIFGGGVPFVAALLVTSTGNKQAGAWLVIVAAVISFIAAASIVRATHGRFLDRKSLGDS
jgi:MHS family proline/betaine transporter-like MFS transporter